eukprot:365145-Chlamydomonas_euryale.AAC.15
MGRTGRGREAKGSVSGVGLQGQGSCRAGWRQPADRRGMHRTHACILVQCRGGRMAGRVTVPHLPRPVDNVVLSLPVVLLG